MNHNGKVKVLIVDDEKDVCKLMKEHFQKKGYRVSYATSAQEAVPLIRVKSPQVMFLDKRMPEVTGIELLRDIRQFNQELKVIMISADTLDTEIEQEMKRLNILGYLEKPVALSLLDEVLEMASKEDGVEGPL